MTWGAGSSSAAAAAGEAGAGGGGAPGGARPSASTRVRGASGIGAGGPVRSLGLDAEVGVGWKGGGCKYQPKGGLGKVGVAAARRRGWCRHAATRRARRCCSTRCPELLAGVVLACWRIGLLGCVLSCTTHRDGEAPHVLVPLPAPRALAASPTLHPRWFRVTSHPPRLHFFNNDACNPSPPPRSLHFSVPILATPHPAHTDRGPRAARPHQGAAALPQGPGERRRAEAHKCVGVGEGGCEDGCKKRGGEPFMRWFV